MLRAGRTPVACRAPLPVASYVKRRGVDAAAAPPLAAKPLPLLGLRRAPQRRSLAGAAPPLRAFREPHSGVTVCARSSGERAAEVRCAALCVPVRFLSRLVASQASQLGARLAAPGGTFRQPAAALQPGRRGTALAATACEAGENEAERQGTFFNRKVELQSLAARLASAPKAVLVMTGPPSCGKTGARARCVYAFLCLCRGDARARCSGAQATRGGRDSVSAAHHHRLPRRRCVLLPLASQWRLMLASAAVAQTI